tara:strand:- start:140 stop:1180 length:1041 start_codon:yes stop_codon:yes gene_type:complete
MEELSMVETSQAPLRVESLNPFHLARFQAISDSSQLPRFQAALLGDWMARLEQRFPDLLPSRSPRCLLAIEADRPLAAVVARPYNRRGSCWSLQLPQQLGESSQWSCSSVRRTLLQQALQLGSPQVLSWVVRCPAGDADGIALMRELGFQPLRPFQAWLPPAAVPEPASQSLPRGLSWQPINRRTAQLLWPIEQGGNFSHLRQITDRHWLDLLDRNGPGSGVLMDGDHVLAGSVQLFESSDDRQLELIRDVAWDPRLDEALPALLQCLLRDGRPDALVTAQDDAPLAHLLLAQGWRQGDEHLLMGRSMWRRQVSPRSPLHTRALDEVLGSLRPQRTPLPTPSLGRR